MRTSSHFCCYITCSEKAGVRWRVLNSVYIPILYHTLPWNFWTKLQSVWRSWHCGLWHQALDTLFWSVLILSRPDHSCRVCFMMFFGEFYSLFSFQILLWSLNKNYGIDGACGTHGTISTAYKILIGKHEGRRDFGKPSALLGVHFT